MDTRSKLTAAMCLLRNDFFEQLTQQKKRLAGDMQRVKQAYQLMEGVLDRHTKHLLEGKVTPPETDPQRFTTKYRKMGAYRLEQDPSLVSEE